MRIVIVVWALLAFTSFTRATVDCSLCNFDQETALTQIALMD